MIFKKLKILTLLFSLVAFCPISKASTSAVVGVSGYVSSISATSVFITEKHGALLEVPKSEVIKTHPKVKKGEYVAVSLDKSFIKATKVKSALDSK